MCKKCDSKCIYFPNIDIAKVEYIIDKNNVKHRVNSKKYICMFFRKKINVNKKCTKHTSYDDIKKQRQEERYL